MYYGGHIISIIITAACNNCSSYLDNGQSFDDTNRTCSMGTVLATFAKLCYKYFINFRGMINKLSASTT